MAHIVNPVLYRIGKNIHWNVLYKSNYKSVGMRFNLILNLTLITIFKMLKFRIIKIFIRVENYAFKLALIAMRLTKNSMIDMDLHYIKNISIIHEPFLSLPAYFGDSKDDRTLKAYKSPTFNYFMRNEWIGRHTWGRDFCSYFDKFVNLDLIFVRNFIKLSEWEVSSENDDEIEYSMEVITAYIIELVNTIKEINSLANNKKIIKNSKLYHYLIIKKIFLLSARGIRFIKECGYRTWYKLFKMGVIFTLLELKKNFFFLRKKLKKKITVKLFNNTYFQVYGKNVSNLKKKKHKKVNWVFQQVTKLKKIFIFKYLLQLILKIIKNRFYSVVSKKLVAAFINLILFKRYKLLNFFYTAGAFPATISRFVKHLKFFKLDEIKPSNPIATSNFIRFLAKSSSSNQSNLKKKKSDFFSGISFFPDLFSNRSERISCLLSHEFFFNDKKSPLKITYKKKNKRDLSLKFSELGAKSSYYLVHNFFEKNNIFYNWILTDRINKKNESFPVINNWLTNKLFALDLNARLTELFGIRVELTLFTLKDALANKVSNDFFRNINHYMSRVFIHYKEKFHMKMGLIFCHFMLLYRVPDLLIAYIVESLQFRVKHYSIVSPLSSLLGLLNLNNYNLSGVKLGFYGRLNGRDRKFRYCIYKGLKPNFLSLDTRIDYSEEQAVTRYGVVHIHIWLYKNEKCQ